MEKINFRNKGEDGAIPINDTNLNLLQDNVENEFNNTKIGDITTEGSPSKCGYKIDNHEIYVSKKNFTMDGDSSNSFIIGFQSQNITPVKYETYIDNGSSIFQGNTPRANGTEVDITQLFTYWNYSSDKFIANSNGFDRTGTIVQVYFYFYYNK